MARIMAKKRQGAEQIIQKMREAEVELERGLKVPQVCKKLEVTGPPDSPWRRRRSHCTPATCMRMQAAPDAAEVVVLRLVGYCARRDGAQRRWAARGGRPHRPAAVGDPEGADTPVGAGQIRGPLDRVIAVLDLAVRLAEVGVTPRPL